jgi:hypothetical protein
MKEGSKHRIALAAFTEGLERERAEEVAEWKALVVTWEKTQHKEGADSPFEYKEAGECSRFFWF